MTEENAATDRVVPEGKWEFDAEVTDAFDDMLARSIPQYETMRSACHDLARRFARPDTDVVDLGCSRGGAIADLVRSKGCHNRFVGVETSGPMLAACRERFKGMMDAGVVDVHEMDLRTDYPPVRASVTMCVLTLQFTPIEYRQRIVKNIWDHTIGGGALILVEKVMGSSADLDRTMVETYLDMKRGHGYTEDQIDRKRLSLEGVLVPVTARWNEELLRGAGFREVDCFWRWMNFAGWIAKKT